MWKGVKSFQFKAQVLKSETSKQCRTRVLYRLHHCGEQRQGVMEHDCSHSATTAPPASLQKEGELHPWLMKLSSADYRC